MFLRCLFLLLFFSREILNCVHVLLVAVPFPQVYRLLDKFQGGLWRLWSNFFLNESVLMVGWQRQGLINRACPEIYAAQSGQVADKHGDVHTIHAPPDIEIPVQTLSTPR